ncbi:hypothetical protein PFLG_00761 [Plasmodium falciparum RAJ116]|uniref:Gp5/Type VI secretion system Vgr C-terminal trimerisation domain-containing protein n=1 Tax=Plasmodium falciparum RAJ116 TaxID=580058 RepID=A0A0L0CVA6_PLAFA|nr:hypothetical protein PFLG_00761 [Plasmodium falciparum RAJ116]
MVVNNDDDNNNLFKLRQEDNIYFNPVLNIFKVENYLEAYKIFKLKNKNKNESISQNKKQSINQNKKQSISQNKKQSISQNKKQSISQNKKQSISQNKKQSISQNKNQSISQNKKQSISQNKKLNLNVGRNHSISDHKNCTPYNEQNIYNKNEEILLTNDKENKKKKKLKQKKEHLSNDSMNNHNVDDNYNNCNFIILIYWPQSLNTFLKILFQKREHNIIILSDQIPSYIYNNNLFPYRYNICYIQKSPLVLFNLILSGILVCEKCIIFKNYLKLDSYQNIVSYNEKTKNINFLEYMCEYNDKEKI